MISFSRLLCILIVISATLIAKECNADNWPGWRGPTGDGISKESEVPLTWSSTENVAWKTPIPGVGHSSPIVWDDAIIVTSAVESDLSRRVIRLDRDTGAVRWNKQVGVGPFEEMHRDNTPASATPVTDGKHIYVAFCLDGKLQLTSLTLDGEIAWQIDVATFESRHGFCTGLILDEDRLLVSGLQDGPDSCIAAFNKTTGEQIWRTRRPRAIRSFSSPCLCAIDGQPAMIVSGAEQTIAYNRLTGKPLWQVDGPAEKTVSSVVCSETLNLAFVAGGRDNRLIAVRLGRDVDDANSDRLIWSTTKGIPYMTSPLLSHDLLHVLSDEGVYHCYDAATGTILRRRRTTGAIRASMVATESRIYITDIEGRTTVLANNGDWNVLAVNHLEGTVLASPAISDGDIIIRTDKDVYMVRE